MALAKAVLCFTRWSTTMAATPSTMVSLGTNAPRFELENPRTGGTDSFDALRGKKGTLVMFICNHCPYVVLIRQKILELAANALEQDIGVIAINSNSEKSHPQDGPKHMKALAEEENWPFPFLFDQDQRVAQAYSAACTPDFFLFDKDAKLFYRGQFDSARPNSDAPITGEDLQHAINALLQNQPAPKDQYPSLGCNIKWKPGNEPT